jgi:hypothetical protein
MEEAKTHIQGCSDSKSSSILFNNLINNPDYGMNDEILNNKWGSMWKKSAMA